MKRNLLLLERWIEGRKERIKKNSNWGGRDFNARTKEEGGRIRGGR